MANKAVIDVEARFVDHVSNESKKAERALDGLGKEAVQTQKDLDKLSKKPIKPVFDADDNKFLKKIRSMEAKMQKMGRTKTAAVLDVIDKGTVKIGKLINKAQAFGRKAWRGILDFNDSKALSVIRKVTSSAESFARKTWTSIVNVKDKALAPIKAIKNALFSIPTLIQTVIAATVVKKAIIDPIGLADQYSGAKIGFSTLLGESEGQAMMDEIDLFAKKTPFKTSGVISNVQKMMAMGWDVERVIDDMETIGDAAAATGKGDEGLGAITYALSEIRSKGKLSTQEINQLASAGIKAKAYLAEGLGFGTDDAGMKKLAEALEDGAIGANQAIELILQGMKEFDGMMDRTANETVSGLKAQLEDVFEINIARRWGQGLQEGARRGIGTIVSLFDDAQDSLEDFGDAVHEVGALVGNWFADKLEKVVKNIQEITGSFEFKNADLKGKMSMLWKGVIADPVSEWWNGGAKEKVIQKAVDIGMWIGKAIVDGIVAGFKALPWWGKLLVGGYAGGKILSGVGNVISGAQNIWGMVNGGAATLSSGAARAGYWALGGQQAATLAGVSGTTAALAGTATIAGGAATLWGGYKAGKSFYNAYGALRAGDKRTALAEGTRGGVTTLGMIGGGAAAAGMAKLGGTIGTFFGGPAGTLVGAGLGALVGWFAGDTIAKNIEAAKWESEGLKKAIKEGADEAKILEETEKALYENAKNHFGQIELSSSEISRLVDQIVWRDDLAAFETFNSARQNAEANLQAMKKASQETDKWMWKAGLGVTFNDDEKEAFQASVNDYITAATALLDNKHYEFTASAELLLNLESEGGKSIIESGNAFYKAEKEALEKAGKEFGDLFTEAIADGFINAKEEEAILAAQEKIASITEKISKAETEAELEVIKVKWGDGNLTVDSFEDFMKTMKSTLETRIAASDSALEVQIANLKLRYPNGGAQYQQELETLISGYKATVETIKADVMGVELQMIGEAYAGELGEDAVKKLRGALETAIGEGIEPITIDDKTLAKWLKVDVKDIEGETAANIRAMLQGVFDQVKLIDASGDILLKLDVKAEKGTITPITPTARELGVGGPFRFSPLINLTPQLGTINRLWVNGSSLVSVSDDREKKFRGGIVGYSDGGMVRGGSQLIEVAEEGSPEMIIPLSSQRRGRALKLWAQAGNMMGVPGFARGGLTNGAQDEGIRFRSYGSSDSSAGGQSVQVDIGGITFEINVNGTDAQSITAAIKAQAAEIAESVAGVLADALETQFENTPVRGGIA